MPVTVSLAPITPKEFGYAQVRHLLNRAGFGGTPEQIEALRKMGPRDAVDYLVEYDRIDPGVDGNKPAVVTDLRRPPSRQQRMKAREARASGDKTTLQQMKFQRRFDQQEDVRQMGEISRWWLGRMVSTPRPLEEKLTLLWHGHFASNYRTVRDSFLMYQQNEFLRTNAAGNFGDLTHGIVHDPAMIRFLDNHNNRKEQPNENLARELMELFTLGEGNYSERDIKEGARALTGYTFRDNDFYFARNAHDDGEKTILGQRGRFDGDDFVDAILKQMQCPRFVCQKLYGYFAADLEDRIPSHARTVINLLAGQLHKHDYELKPVLKILFSSRHFYAPALMSAKVKSPAELIASTLRTMRPPARDLTLLTDACASMGQRLFDPPSVAGWAGGRSWINTSTLFVRQNAAAYLLTGKLPFQDGWTRADVDYDPTFLTEGLSERSTESIVDHLLRVSLGDQVVTQRKEQLLAFIKERGGEITPDRSLALLMLVTTTPEYQLC